MKRLALAAFAAGASLHGQSALADAAARQPGNIFVIAVNVNFVAHPKLMCSNQTSQAIPVFLEGFKAFANRAGYDAKNIHYYILEDELTEGVTKFCEKNKYKPVPTNKTVINLIKESQKNIKGRMSERLRRKYKTQFLDYYISNHNFEECRSFSHKNCNYYLWTPNRNRIQQIISDISTRAESENDRVFIYISSHGFNDGGIQTVVFPGWDRVEGPRIKELQKELNDTELDEYDDRKDYKSTISELLGDNISQTMKYILFLDMCRNNINYSDNSSDATVLSKLSEEKKLERKNLITFFSSTKFYKSWTVNSRREFDDFKTIITNPKVRNRVDGGAGYFTIALAEILAEGSAIKEGGLNSILLNKMLKNKVALIAKEHKEKLATKHNKKDAQIPTLYPPARTFDIYEKGYNDAHVGVTQVPNSDKAGTQILAAILEKSKLPHLKPRHSRIRLTEASDELREILFGAGGPYGKPAAFNNEFKKEGNSQYVTDCKIPAEWDINASPKGAPDARFSELLKLRKLHLSFISGEEKNKKLFPFAKGLGLQTDSADEDRIARDINQIKIEIDGYSHLLVFAAVKGEGHATGTAKSELRWLLLDFERESWEMFKCDVERELNTITSAITDSVYASVRPVLRHEFVLERFLVDGGAAVLGSRVSAQIIEEDIRYGLAGSIARELKFWGVTKVRFDPKTVIESKLDQRCLLYFQVEKNPESNEVRNKLFEYLANECKQSMKNFNEPIFTLSAKLEKNRAKIKIMPMLKRANWPPDLKKTVRQMMEKKAVLELPSEYFQPEITEAAFSDEQKEYALKSQMAALETMHKIFSLRKEFMRLRFKFSDISSN